MNKRNNFLPTRNLRLVSIFLALYLSFPLALLATGLGEMEWGLRAFGPTPITSALFHFVVLAFGIAAILVSPMVQFVWKLVPGSYSASAALCFSAVMTAMPIFAFGYYLGGIRTDVDLQELLTAAIPAALFSALVYERTRSTVAWVFVLTVTVFFPYYLFSELLSGLHSYVSFVSSNQYFAIWRVAFPLAATLGLLILRFKERTVSSSTGYSSQTV